MNIDPAFLPATQTSLPRPKASTVEVGIFIVILLLALTSRFFALDERVVSHDENSHIYYAWQYANGQGYQHTPVTHGPLQFHLIALSYLLFGDNEFTARLPHALASVLTVLLLWKWRSYLGRAGTLIAAFLMLISPMLLYYGRYARNEALVALLGTAMLYLILRFLETGANRHLLLFTLVLALQFATKETTFIYAAQAMLFLGFELVRTLQAQVWPRPELRRPFHFLAITSALLIVLVFASAAVMDTTALPALQPRLAGFALLTSIGATFLLLRGYGWRALVGQRTFALLIVLGTFTLPQLSPMLVEVLGANPLDYAFSWPGWDLAAIWSQAPAKTAFSLALFMVLSVYIGLAWDRKRWPWLALLFWGIYATLYTSLFSNWQGFFTGVIGSLGYWLEQQAVQRGGQPWYYYLLIQLPLYEYLPLLGTLAAAVYGIRRLFTRTAPVQQAPVEADPQTAGLPEVRAFEPDRTTLRLLSWWVISALVGYSLAGEKMPWLTVHITLPLILLSGWGLGTIVAVLKHQQAIRIGATDLAALLLAPVSALGLILSLLGSAPPFQGKSLEQLQDSGAFILLLIVFFGSIYALLHDRKSFRTHLAWLVLAGFTALSVLTIRTSVRAAFSHPNEATEYLVYAHGSDGIRTALEQIENLSVRTARGRDIRVVYDSTPPYSGVAWPFTWYFRNYPNAWQFEQVDESLHDAVVVIADERNAEAVEALLGDEYYRRDYLRMVWPNQDYFDLNAERFRSAFRDRTIRAALVDIWTARNFDGYASLSGSEFLTPSNWEPSDRMSVFYLRNDFLNLWEYPMKNPVALVEDPYERGWTALPSDLTFGICGSASGQFQSPHGIDIAPDGKIYIADSGNHRIVVISPAGETLASWGSFGDAGTGAAQAGTFNEPWDLAVDAERGWVYVADTWNHRIQKFDLNGNPITLWGYGAYDPESTDPFGFWGPRAIAVDGQGRVYVADTGNKRVLVYDENGTFLNQIGLGGMDEGEFEEPVGLALDRDGRLYVADTWNQRIQVFSPNPENDSFSFLTQWPIQAWEIDSLDNKPYLTVDEAGNLFVTDPESARVLQFSSAGAYLRSWGDFGSGSGQFGLASGIAVDPEGGIWVSDPSGCRITRFSLP